MRNLKKIVAVGATAAMTMAMSVMAMAATDVTFHFKNTNNWEDCGAWIYEGVGWTKNVTPKEFTPAYDTIYDHAIWPGAKMTAEADYDGWYTITATFEDTSAGAIMVFNNLVADEKVDTESGGHAEDQEFVDASGLKKNNINGAKKIQAPNAVIMKGKFTATEYWCDFNGDVNGSNILMTDTAPASYKKKASTVVNNATAVATGKSTVKLSWDKYKGAQKYNVFCYDSATKKNVKVASTTKSTVTVTKFNKKALKAGKVYKFTIKAIKGNKSIASSNTVYAVPLNIPTVKSVSNTAKGKVTVKVNAVSKASGYIIYRSTKQSSGYEPIGSTTKTTYTDKTAKKGKTYYYKAAAYRDVSGIKAMTEVSAKSYKKIKVRK